MTTQKQTSLLILLISLAVFFVYRNIQAENCSDLTGSAKDQCKELEEKAKVYTDLIKLKDKQQDTLAAQMDIISKEQTKTQQELSKVETEAEMITKQIDTLERSIQEKETLLKTQKKILTSLLQAYYEYDQQGLLDLFLMNENLTELASQPDRLEQSSTTVKDMLVAIQTSRSELTREYQVHNEKKTRSEEIKEQLQDRHFNLQASENQKKSLLQQTAGEEEKYKGLLANVEEQKKELFNFSDASNVDEIVASVGDYPAPTSNLASTSWYYSQRDSRWANKRIGNSSSLMKDYGCAVSCVSMVFRKMGSSIDPGKMCREKIFYYDLIKWPSSWNPDISLNSSVNHGNISWSKIDSEIKKGTPVIVYIRKTNGKGGHYVVITGKDKKDYIVHDPYFGPNLYLGTSRSLVGKIGSDSGTNIDQMLIYDN